MFVKNITLIIVFFHLECIHYNSILQMKNKLFSNRKRFFSFNQAVKPYFKNLIAIKKNENKSNENLISIFFSSFHEDIMVKRIIVFN